MVFFHEIVGPILASVAVILTLILFKKTLDFQAYRELDLNYIDILKIGIEKADILEKEYTAMPYVQRKIYDQYASMVFALIETIYDRNKADKTWYPYIRRERDRYLKWFEDKDHTRIFNPKFVKFVKDPKNFKPEWEPPVTRRRKLGNVIKEYWFLFLAIVIIKETFGYEFEPSIIWTGNGYHIYIPIESRYVLEEMPEFSKYEEPSKRSLRFAEWYLSDGKADSNYFHNVSFWNCMLRIPWSYNSKCVAKNNNLADSSTQVRIINNGMECIECLSTYLLEVFVHTL